MKIAIAGAGIGGLTAAALLARAGHEICVFDQFDAPRPVGSGLVIQPVGQAVLASSGALPHALEKGNQIKQMVGVEATHGRIALHVSYTKSGVDRFGLAILRPSLFEAVLGAANASGARLIAAHRVIARQGQQLRFEDGAISDPFDLIIDAAGAGSPLSALKGRALPYGAIWSTVDLPDGGPLRPDMLHQRYHRASKMAGVMPSGSLPNEATPKAAVFWSLGPGGYDDFRAAPIKTWRDTATALWPEFAPFAEQITDHDQMVMAQYTHGTLARPYSDGLVHIGDAAHRASPQLGQGANMALLDAYALTCALQMAEGRAALALYARLRRWHIWAYQAMSWAFTPQYQSDSRILPILRDYALMPLSRIFPLPRVLSHVVGGDFLQPYAGLALADAP
ncbi:MAG: FAD-dependent oxidoreductase [Paracoccaceae bacterium]